MNNRRGPKVNVGGVVVGAKRRSWLTMVLLWMAVVVMVLVLCYAILQLRARRPPVRPILLLSVARDCDFVTFSNETYVVCADGTTWQVEAYSVGIRPDKAGDRVIVGLEDADNPGLIRDDQERVIVGLDDADGELMTIRYSHYWPPLCGPNCGRCVDDVCVSKMASGLPWEDWTNRAVACPPEWPFNTRVTLGDKTWVCLDRGGKIITHDGLSWVDFMEKEPRYDHGTRVEARVLFVR